MKYEMCVCVRHITVIVVGLCLQIPSDRSHAYAEKSVSNSKGPADLDVSPVEGESLFTSDVGDKRSDKISFSDRKQDTPLLRKSTELQIATSMSHTPVVINSVSLPADHTKKSHWSFPGIFDTASPHDIISMSALRSKAKVGGDKILKDTPTQRTSYDADFRLPTITSYAELVGSLSSHVYKSSQRNRKRENIHSQLKNNQNQAITSDNIDQNKNTKPILSETDSNMHTKAMSPNYQRNQAPNQPANDEAIGRGFPSDTQHRAKQFIVNRNEGHRRRTRVLGNHPGPNNSNFWSKMGQSAKQHNAAINVYERFLSLHGRLLKLQPMSKVSSSFKGRNRQSSRSLSTDFLHLHRRLNSHKYFSNKATLIERANLYYDKMGFSMSDIGFIEAFLKDKSELMSGNFSNSLVSCGQIGRSATEAMKDLLNILPGLASTIEDGKRRVKSASYIKTKLDNKGYWKEPEKLITDLLLLYGQCMDKVRHGSLILHNRAAATMTTNHTTIETPYQVGDLERHKMDKTSTLQGFLPFESELQGANKKFQQSYERKTYNSASIEKDSVMKNTLEVVGKRSNNVNKNVEMYHCKEGQTKGCYTMAAKQDNHFDRIRVKKAHFSKLDTRRSNFPQKFSRMLTKFLPGKKPQNSLHSLDQSVRYKKKQEIRRGNSEVRVKSTPFWKHGTPEENEVIVLKQERNNFENHKQGKSTDEEAKTNNVLERRNTAKKDGVSVTGLSGEDEGVQNMHTKDDVTWLDDKMNATNSAVTQKDERQQEVTYDTDKDKEEGHTWHSRSLLQYEEFTNGLPQNPATDIMSNDIEDSIAQNHNENKIVNDGHDDSSGNQMPERGQFNSAHGASQIDINHALPASDIPRVPTPLYENTINSADGFDNFPNSGYGSLNGFQFSDYGDLRNDDDGQVEEELPYRSFSRFQIQTTAGVIASGETTLINSKENGNYDVSIQQSGHHMEISTENGKYKMNLAETGNYKLNSLEYGKDPISNAESGKDRINSAETEQYKINSVENAKDRISNAENGQYGINSLENGKDVVNNEDNGQYAINSLEHRKNMMKSEENVQYGINRLENGKIVVNNEENGQYGINSQENGKDRITHPGNAFYKINKAEKKNDTYSNLEDLANMPHSSDSTMTDKTRMSGIYQQHDYADKGSNVSNAGSDIKALPKRVKRSIALSFDKPSTTSSLPLSSVKTSPATRSLLTFSLSFLDVTNSSQTHTAEWSPFLLDLSTESPSLSEDTSTTRRQETATTQSSSAIEVKHTELPKPVLKIGVILAYSHRFPWVINKTRPAIEIAADFVSSPEGPLSNFRIEIEYRDSQCSDTFGSLEGIDLYVKKLAHVFIGPSCDYSIAPLARFSYYWGIPILTAGALVEAFANKAEYKLLTRVQGSYTKSAEFFVSIALEHGWSQVGLVYHEVKYDGRVSRSNCAFTIEPIFYSVELALNSKPWHVSFNEKEATEDTIMSVMKQLSANCRIVVLCASPSTVREIMIKAHELNFDNGEYVFFNIDLFSSKNASETPWYRSDDTPERNNKARKAYESLMTVTLRMPTSTEYREFSNEVKARAAEMYPNFTYGEDEVNSFVGAFHDAVLLYALALNETLAENGSISDGEAITRRMWNRTFTGITGNVSIDPNGDRNADYSLLDLNPDTGKFEVVANYFGNKRRYQPVDGKAIHWAGGRLGPPPDTPTCGFDGSKCPPDEPFPEYGIVIIVLGTLLLLVLIVVFSIYRHIKLEAELAEMNWRVRWDDILFGVLEKNKKLDRQGSRLSLGRSSVSSGCSGDTIAVHLNDARNRQLFTKTGYYKGAIIAIKPINRNNITITKPMLLEIKRMKDLQNDHIVRFIGACIDCSNSCILTEYCPKGSLQDVLENDQIKLDWMFRYSIMQDIVRGMAYLQGTEIHSHGNLKSSNCVVDSRFVVKITDFGLHHLRGTANPSEEDKQNYSYYQSMLWTAPELLRMNYRPPEGTVKGDVYSFAIICQEIVYRNGAFYIQHYDLSPQDIYQKVKLGLKPYFRPTLEEFDCPCDELAGVIRRCWSEDPADRPDFQALKSIIRKLNRDGDKGNILDNLLSRMEQYANNLEALVEERTADYLQQKKKAEDLLYNMLPKKVASQLIRGESVTAEWYDNVSIYFSDICGFTALSAESTPMEVVDLLNDLYTTFDSIIEHFDVYKVETIGDAYMVVSGLPDRNGNIHAREIARMSLSLQKATLTFRIRHKPDYQLKIRIGIHTGPVCAGVVGLKMPRYCLFGDTVNTASRMESNGLPLKIHVSPQCKEVLDYFGSFELELRGNVEMKGKGQVKTYWLLGEKNNSDSPGVTLNIL